MPPVSKPKATHAVRLELLLRYSNTDVVRELLYFAVYVCYIFCYFLFIDFREEMQREREEIA